MQRPPSQPQIPDLMSVLPAVTAALADPEQPRALFTALERMTAEVLGHRLFTLMRYHAGPSESERVWSSQPSVYPVGGRKRVADTPWAQRIFREGRPYLGRTPAEIQAVFPDHELIFSLGCGSVLNLPVVYAGRVLGTMNLLREAGGYNEGQIALGLACAALAVPAYLLLPA